MCYLHLFACIALLLLVLIYLCIYDYEYGDGGCGWWQPFIGGLTAQVGWLSLRVGGQLTLSLHSSNEPGELSQWFWS